MKRIISTAGLTTALAFAVTALAPVIDQAPQARAFEIVVDTDRSTQQDRGQSRSRRATYRR